MVPCNMICTTFIVRLSIFLHVYKLIVFLILWPSPEIFCYYFRFFSFLIDLYVCAKSLQSCPTLCDPKTIAHQVSLSMRFSRQEYWSALPCPPPGDLPNPGIEPESLMSPVLKGRLFTSSDT